jgi:hypothetical protein
MTVSRTLFAAVSVVLLCACSSAQRNGPQVGTVPLGLQIRVENDSGANLRVYVQMGSSETPLGRVDANEHAVLRLPVGVSGGMRLVVRNGVGRTAPSHASEPFSLSYGQWMAWRLRDSPGASEVPRISSVHVFSCEDPSKC